MQERSGASRPGELISPTAIDDRGRASLQLVGILISAGDIARVGALLPLL